MFWNGSFSIFIMFHESFCFIIALLFKLALKKAGSIHCDNLPHIVALQGHVVTIGILWFFHVTTSSDLSWNRKFTYILNMFFVREKPYSLELLPIIPYNK